MLWYSSGKNLQPEEDQSAGRNVGKVFNPVVKLVLENQPFLMPEPAEKPSLHTKPTPNPTQTSQPHVYYTLNTASLTAVLAT